MRTRRIFAAALPAAALTLALAVPAGAEVCQDCPGGGGGGGTSNKAPTARVTGPAEAFRNATVTLNGSTSSDPDGTIVEWAWDLDGNDTYETVKTTSTVDTSYPNLGDRTIKLRVKDNGGKFASTSFSLKIVNRMPAVTVSCSDTELGGATTCVANATDPDGSIGLYAWDFDGNGFNDGAGRQATFTYGAAGTFEPKVRVTDNDGGPAEGKGATIVWTPKAGAAFGVSDAIAGQAVTFTAAFGEGEAEGQATYDREWSTSADNAWAPTTRIATYTFTQPGTYEVRVRQLRDGTHPSQTTETVQTVVVKPKPATGGGGNPGTGGGGGGGDKNPGTGGGTQNPNGGGTPQQTGTPAGPAATPAVTPTSTRAASTTRKASRKKATCKTAKKAKKGKKAACKKAKKKSTKRR